MWLDWSTLTISVLNKLNERTRACCISKQTEGGHNPYTIGPRHWRIVRRAIYFENVCRWRFRGRSIGSFVREFWSFRRCPNASRSGTRATCFLTFRPPRLLGKLFFWFFFCYLNKPIAGNTPSSSRTQWCTPYTLTRGKISPDENKKKTQLN